MSANICSLKLHLAVSFQFPIAFASTIVKVVQRQFLWLPRWNWHCSPRTWVTRPNYNAALTKGHLWQCTKPGTRDNKGKSKKCSIKRARSWWWHRVDTEWNSQFWAIVSTRHCSLSKKFDKVTVPGFFGKLCLQFDQRKSKNTTLHKYKNEMTSAADIQFQASGLMKVPHHKIDENASNDQCSCGQTGNLQQSILIMKADFIYVCSALQHCCRLRRT